MFMLRDTLTSTYIFHSHFSVNCQWASWNSWQSCSKSCGLGTQKRIRSKLVVAKNGGNECNGSNNETRSCNTNNCPGTYKTYTNYTNQLQEPQSLLQEQNAKFKEEY